MINTLTEGVTQAPSPPPSYKPNSHYKLYIQKAGKFSRNENFAKFCEMMKRVNFTTLISHKPE